MKNYTKEYYQGNSMIGKGQVAAGNSIDSIIFLGIRVHLLTEERLHRCIANIISENRQALILNVNVHLYNVAHIHPWLVNFLNSSDLTFCDGAGVVLGARLFGHRIPGRITYADSIWRLAALSEQQGFTLFFLGAKPGVAEKAAHNLQAVFPRLNIFTHHGYFDMSKDSEENNEIVKRINDAKPNILMVGFGMPIQEKWLQENWVRLHNVNIAFAIGALFDFTSGELRRGPRWMTDNGLEWLARLLIEPKRLWHRYTVENLFFLYLVLKERFKRKKN